MLTRVQGPGIPEDYFAAVEAKNPGALASQWIRQDPALWRIDRYPDFLAARRELLAEADPAVDCEVNDPATGEVLAIAEACWPEGLQPGQSDSVILELDPAEADPPRLEEIGYEVFTSIESLRGYVHRRSAEAAGPVAESPRVG